MELNTRESITRAEVAQCKRTGLKRDAIFGDRKALMEEIYASGEPIFCDQSYYATYDKYYRVKRNGDHFNCDGYSKFEEWRDCHYYSQYEDADGNKFWVMSGGRYD